jgi:hypothetical protein
MNELITNSNQIPSKLIIVVKTLVAVVASMPNNSATIGVMGVRTVTSNEPKIPAIVIHLCYFTA